VSADLLGQATRALRETAGPAAAEATFSRVLRDVRRGERRRRSVFAAALPFALLLTTMGAWAATTGRLAAVARQLWPAKPAPLATYEPAKHAEGRTAGPEIVPLRPPLAALAPGVAPRAVPVKPAHRAPRLEAAPPVYASPPAPSPDDLYRRAHDAHFERADYGAALELWNRYLALSPLPRFALEARFNRAIALLRLGRRDEASQALRPFAGGDYGAYRRDEARALLRTLAAAQNE
jgi:hypothetical protein